MNKTTLHTALGFGFVLAACARLPSSQPCGGGAEQCEDEGLVCRPQRRGFPAADEDYFADMDYGITRDPKAVAAALEPYLPGIAPADATAAAVKAQQLDRVDRRQRPHVGHPGHQERRPARLAQDRVQSPEPEL